MTSKTSDSNSSAVPKLGLTLPSHIKKRLPSSRHVQSIMGPEDESRRPILKDTSAQDGVASVGATTSWISGNRWIFLAIASGTCAAFNGVFAKLTTTELTSTFSDVIARCLGLSSVEHGIETGIRCIFFGLNLAFNGVMWTLFTAALAQGNSTTQVTIINTCSNFLLTALVGFVIFYEALPPLWWVGAVMLVAGNVIVGSKDESSECGLKEAAHGEADDLSSSSSSGADERPARNDGTSVGVSGTGGPDVTAPLRRAFAEQAEEVWGTVVENSV